MAEDKPKKGGLNSLQDALRTTFIFIRVIMFLLVIAFVFSGVRTIEKNIQRRPPPTSNFSCVRKEKRQRTIKTNPMNIWLHLPNGKKKNDDTFDTAERIAKNKSKVAEIVPQMN